MSTVIHGQAEALALRWLSSEPMTLALLQYRTGVDRYSVFSAVSRLKERGIADSDPTLGWFLTPAYLAKRNEALDLVLTAAENWARELVDYIIPDSEQRDDDDAAAGQRESANAIFTAILTLSGVGTTTPITEGP